MSLLKSSERRSTVQRLVERDNEIIEQVETDPSLKVTIG
jgi:hypothetical protein